MRHKTPKKPEITSAPMSLLLDYYHERLDAYNAKTEEFCSTRKMDPKPRLFGPLTEGDITRPELVQRIRKMQVRLGNTIRDRAIELLLEKKLDANGDIMMSDGRLVGRSYDEILQIIAKEHPYGSTSAACLRWYIVQVQEDCDFEGDLIYEFPEYRPRSAPKRKDTPIAQAEEGQSNAA